MKLDIEKLQKLANLPNLSAGDCWRMVVEGIMDIDKKACRNNKCEWKGLHYHENGCINKFPVKFIHERFLEMESKLGFNL